MSLQLLLFVGAFCAASANVAPANCPKCEKTDCPTLIPSNCLFGTMLDRCGCCLVCAKMEGEQCDLPDTPYQHGKCGHELECQKTEEGNYCLCKTHEIICGSDDQRYADMCKLVAARTRSGLGEQLVAKSKGPCNPAAEILTAPESIRANAGDSVVLSCEAIGLPPPLIFWLSNNARNISVTLPADQTNMLISTRGGPDKYKVTSWLQIENVQKEQEGDYNCVAKNKLNTAIATARVHVDLQRRK